MVGALVELFVDRIAPSGADKMAVLLHGILGSGQNLRTVARRFTESAEGWAAAVIDLRGHGRSMALDDRPANLATVADDLIETLAHEGLPVAALIGHSFGGKVALEAASRSVLPLSHLVVMDSLPGARPDRHGSESIEQVLGALEAEPGPFASRDAFVDVMIARGLTKPIGQWLATSLRRQDDGAFRFGIDLGYVRAVLGDYFARDLWPVLESPPAGLRGHLLIGDRSQVFGPADRARAIALASRGILTLDVLDTGHWVHAEDPEGVVRALANRLSSIEESV
jgi:pimeloyl-ACP methyl ester carboxylesterase